MRAGPCGPLGESCPEHRCGKKSRDCPLAGLRRGAPYSLRRGVARIRSAPLPTVLRETLGSGPLSHHHYDPPMVFRRTTTIGLQWCFAPSGRCPSGCTRCGPCITSTRRWQVGTVQAISEAFLIPVLEARTISRRGRAVEGHRQVPGSDERLSARTPYPGALRRSTQSGLALTDRPCLFPTEEIDDAGCASAIAMPT